MIFFLLQCGFSLLAESGESGRIVYGDLGEHLAVEGDVSLLQTVDECRIVHIIQLAGCADTGYPKSAEISLFETSADISVLTGLPDRFLGGFEQSAFAAPVALC